VGAAAFAAPSHAQRTERDLAKEFVRGRAVRSQGDASAAERLRAARIAAATIQANPRSVPLTTPWQAVGPVQVQTATYGKVTGRVTSIAVDPNDASGNTVYVGTTGGGIWKSENVAGAAASVTFAPLMDALPVFSNGTNVIPSLSIGAVTVQPGGGVVLAGTGDPNDASDSYYGEGALRSADGGATWTLVQNADGTSAGHTFLGEGFAGFAWSGVSPNVVVAAVSSSAEGGVVGASTLGKSVRGLFYSTDAGATWVMATLMDGATVVQSATTSFAAYEGNAATSVVWNPMRKKFYAAVRFHGYYESADGIGWTRMAVQPGAGLTVANCPSRAGIAGAQSCPLFRGALAVQPVTGDMFALTVDLNDASQGLWQDLCAASSGACNTDVSWSNQLDATPMETNGAIPQGDYNLTLNAVPSSGDTILFAGTSEVFRCSLASGCALRNTTQATTGCAATAKVAPNQHAMAWSGGGTIFFGNDGGLWRSSDLVAQTGAACSASDATHFENLNGGLGSLAQVTGLATDPGDAETMLVGLGAMGSAATTSASSQIAWTQMGVGEGGAVAIDSSDPRNWFVQSGGGVSIVSCTKGTLCAASDFAGVAQIGAAQVDGDAALVDAPFLIDPALHTNAIVGTCRVWRGSLAGAGTWSSGNAISAPLSGPASSVCDTTNASIRALAAGGPAAMSSNAQSAGSPVIYAGMAGALTGGNTAGGHVFVTTTAQTANGATTWSDRALNNVTNDAAHQGRFNPGDYDISGIAVDARDATGKTVYGTVMGFGVPHVYRSADAGVTWTSMTSNLPDVPANAVVVDPNDSNTVYVATDTGVYVTSQIAMCATVNCWSVYGTGLPQAPATQLSMQTAVTVPGASAQGALRVGTHGRGVWQIPLLTAGNVATVPVIVLTPGSLIFAGTTIGATSAAQTISIANTGTAASALGTASVTGDYTIKTNTCGATLAVQTSCTVSIAFTPAASGTRSGSFTIATDVGVQTAALTGTGNAVATDTLSPGSLTFANTLVNATSGVQSVTLTNSGDVAVTLVQATIVSGDFTVVNGCGTTVAAHSTCTLQVTFSPHSVGAQTGVLQLTDVLGTQTVGLSGTGIAGPGVSLTPGVLNFGAIGVGAASTTQAVTLTNNGGSPLVVQSVTVSSGFAFAGGTNVCTSTTTLPVGANCLLPVVFVPGTAGTRTGMLTVASNAAGSPQVVSLSGTGVDFTLTANGATSASITSGKSAVFAMLLTPAAALTGQTVTFGCSGVPAHAKCTVTPATVGLNTATVVTVTVQTGLSANTLPVVLIALLPVSWLARRRRACAVLCAATLFAAMFLAGCGAGRQIPSSSSAGGAGSVATPSGTYPIVVSATAAGVVRTVGITVVVQ
jgi:hypothetical protein